MTEADGLVAAFSEYAVEKWETGEWRSFGRGTGTTDLIDGHDRLYRSLSFGDDDYGDCVWEMVPKVLSEGTGSSARERMALVAEFIPHLVTWIKASGTHRTLKRFLVTLATDNEHLPPEWESDARAWLAETTPLALPAQASLTPSEAGVPASSWGTPISSVPIPHEPFNEWESIAVAAREPRMAPAIESPKQIFVVHGRDTATVNEVKVHVHGMTGIMPQILSDQPGQGDTIIEKFERHADASHYAIVLLTPDDEGRLAGTGQPQPRARQNVILELGYFFGKLGRKRVVVINKGVEQPSDVHGLNYIAHGTTTWLEELRRELKAAGFVIHN